MQVYTGSGRVCSTTCAIETGVMNKPQVCPLTRGMCREWVLQQQELLELNKLQVEEEYVAKHGVQNLVQAMGMMQVVIDALICLFPLKHIILY